MTHEKEKVLGAINNFIDKVKEKTGKVMKKSSSELRNRQHSADKLDKRSSSFTNNTKKGNEGFDDAVNQVDDRAKDVQKVQQHKTEGDMIPTDELQAVQDRDAVKNSAPKGQQLDVNDISVQGDAVPQNSAAQQGNIIMQGADAVQGAALQGTNAAQQGADTAQDSAQRGVDVAHNIKDRAQDSVQGTSHGTLHSHNSEVSDDRNMSALDYSKKLARKAYSTIAK